MIRRPFFLAVALSGLVLLLKALRDRKPFDRVFNILPVPFWCYMLPMLGTAVGLFPSASPLYKLLSQWLLPVCLSWLLVGVDVKAVVGLGRRAVILMAAGFGGIVAGCFLAGILLRPWLPAGSWMSLGALSATWTGGSANLLAVKEFLSIPEDLFSPIVVTDGLFAYAWMSLLVAVSGHAARFDRWTGAGSDWEAGAAPSVRPLPAGLLLFLGLVLAGASVLISLHLPSLGGWLKPGAWAVLIVTTASLALASGLSYAGRGAPESVEKTGGFLLLILVASLGAQADVTAAARFPVFLAAGLLVLTVHGLVLLAAARWAKIPLALLATVSQACVGGVVSTPMVAAVYRPALAAVGLLLAVAANAVGTYVGLAAAALCRLVMR
jgi:uncharacterized membrane protein